MSSLLDFSHFDTRDQRLVSLGPTEPFQSKKPGARFHPSDERALHAKKTPFQFAPLVGTRIGREEVQRRTTI